MGAEIMNKFLKVIGIGGNSEEEYDDGYAEEYDEMYEEDAEEEDPYTQASTGRRNSTRASIKEVEENNKSTRILSVNNGMTSSKMVITQPTCYNDVEEVGAYLKCKKSVIINLENISKEEGRRVIDFLSGSIFMIEGNIQKVSGTIYLMTPKTVEVQNDVLEGQYSNGNNQQQQEQRQSFSWLK